MAQTKADVALDDFAVLHKENCVVMQLMTEPFGEEIESFSCFQLCSSVNDSISPSLVALNIEDCSGKVVFYGDCIEHDGNRLSAFLQKCSTNQCVGCILVNSDERKILDTIDFSRYTFPIYLLDTYNGTRLKELAKKCDLFIKTHSEETSQHLSGSRRLMRLISRKTTTKPESMTDYVIKNWNPDPDLSSVSELLKHCFLFFQKLEDEAKKENLIYDMSEINRHIFSPGIISATFQEMFPVYIYYTMHVVQNPYAYTNNDQMAYIAVIIGKFHDLVVSHSDKIFDSLFKFRPENLSHHMKLRPRWKDLAVSFLKMLENWLRLQDGIPQNIFAIAIPTIIIAQVIMKECGSLKSELQKLWWNHLLKYANRLSFRQQGIAAVSHIHSLRNGLKFQTVNNHHLQAECYFSPKNFKDLLSPQDDRLVSLLEARNALLTLPESLQHEWRTSFVSDFVMPLRTVYRDVLRKRNYSHFTGICSQGGWTGMIMEGMGLILQIQSFIEANECKESFAEKSFKWLRMLVKCVQFDKITNRSQLGHVDGLFDESKIVANHWKKMKQKLCSRLKQKLKFLPPESFLIIESYTKQKEISDDSLFEEYLEETEIQRHADQDAIICSKTAYFNLIEEWVSRNSPKLMTTLINFLNLVYKYYQMDERPSDFFADLMQLNVHGLLPVTSESSELNKSEEKVLTDFLQKKMSSPVAKKIFYDLLCYLELPVHSTENRFQYLVCKTVLEGIKNVELGKEDERFFGMILSQCQIHFSKGQLNVMSPQTRFVCGIIHIFSSKVNLTNLSWFSTRPISILSLLNTILPLYNLCDGKAPQSCYEIFCCFEFFCNVRKKIESIGETLNKESIPFNQLKNFRDTNSLQEITRIIEVFKLQKGSVAIEIEKVDRLFKKFSKVRMSITGILVPSFNAKNVSYYDSLYRILEKYRIQMPKDLHDELQEMVDLSPIDTFLAKYCGTQEEIQLKFNESKNIVETEKLLRRLREFLGPLCDSLHIFCFFNTFTCSFFKNSIERQCYSSNESVISVEKLSLACDEAVKVIKKAASGNVTLNQLGLSISNEETKIEISIIQFFTKQIDDSIDCNCDVGFKALCSLANIDQVMSLIEVICKKYELNNCMQDPTFLKLSSHAEKLRIPEEITLKSAIDIEDEFKEGLPNLSGNYNVYIKLYCELTSCVPYAQFLRSKGFIGEEGKRKFSQERNLITQEIQHTLEQRILDDLWDAYSILCYFLNTEIVFHEWKNGLQSLNDVESCTMQIKALQQHSINQLENVFALKESESKESTWKQLNALFANGSAVYRVGKDSPVTLLVQFKEREGRVTERWDLKRLSEFATAVELMLVNKEDQDNEPEISFIKYFLDIFENCLGIIEILGKLKDAGHFEFLEQRTYSHTFERCSLEWKSMLENLKKRFHDWETETPGLREKYSYLSFFSNWKVYEIYDVYKLVKSRKCSMEHLERLIRSSMLFAYSPQSMAHQNPSCQSVESTFEAVQPDMNDPFSVVGQIISLMWQNSKCQNRQLDEHRPSLRNELNIFRLYYLPDCSNLKLYSTALDLLNSPITPFQVLPCTRITTQEALVLFFQRMKFMSNIRYILIDVNVLPVDLQEIVIKECSKLLEHANSTHIQYDLYFIESKPSLMRTMPWCFQDNISLECGSAVKKEYGCSQIECNVIYGHAGNGKSFYIQSRMEELGYATIVLAINEGFSPKKCIKVLSTVSEDNDFCAVHLNFTLPFLETYAVTEEENRDFQMTCKLVNWFFFSLLLSGYVEDYQSGESFSVVQFEKIHVFVEVPVLLCSSKETDYLDHFLKTFPIFYFIKTLESTVCINSEKMRFDATESGAILVSKYFDARKHNKLDVLYRAPTGLRKLFSQKDPSLADGGVRIGNCSDLNKDASLSTLEEIFRKHSIKDRKIYQKMFVRYMYRRCKFMDDSYQLRYFEGKIPSMNEKGEFVKLDGKKLRSSLLYLMENEAAEMCNTDSGHGFNPPHIQLVYEEGCFSILTREGPAQISSEKMDIISRHGFKVPSPRELKDQTVLEEYLCRALKIRQTSGEGVPVLRNRGYVLTLDYLLKMISVHERQQSGLPVIISGETGVGKTFLLETLSDLYNYSQQQELDRWRNSLFCFLRKKGINAETEEDLISEFSLKHSSSLEILKDVHEWFHKMQADYDILCLFPLIDFGLVKREIPEHFDNKTCFDLARTFLFGENRQLFIVFKVHTGLTPSDIKEFLVPIIEEEHALQVTHERRPRITIFFDEVNTSSCLGFLKEIVVDHYIDGEPLPENIFIIAACNPHRGNSVSTIVKGTGNSTDEVWFKGDYLVRPLHPSIELLIWDFGFLDQNQEYVYIESKLKLLETTITNSECEILIDKIAESQNLMRQFTQEYLVKSNVNKTEAIAASHSAVSQRDIQRVLKIYLWLKKSFESLEKYGYTEANATDSNWQISVRAMYLSLALVYYFRLNEEYREKYANHLDSKPSSVVEVGEGKRGIRITFTKALTDEFNWLMENIELPPGVADTKALRENLFSIITCTMAKIPLIIIGPPGSSKTLSFKIAVANLLGEVSRKPAFRNCVMKCIEPYIYQCSKHSKSDDIKILFEKATLRQQQIDKSGKNATVVVFMDEAGLPEEKLQVLKILHYLLDDPKVSFVALSNTILDAAKSNRAICLFQTHSSQEDLQHLAGTILGFSSESIPTAIKGQITCLTDVYFEKMLQKEFNSIFGLRDILHFFSHIRRKLSIDEHFIPPAVILSSLQRNFSGGSNFHLLAEDFLSKCGLQLSQIASQAVMSSLMTLKDSLADKPKDLSFENEVRYKMLIDHSDNESIVQLLFKFHVLERKTTRLYCLSKLLGDRLQKVTTVAKIKNSIIHGHTVILIQCDEIFESFYDLFNQRFTFIDDHQKQTRQYYARIASGSKSANCLVHPNFQCVVLVKLSEVQSIPAPFMNRFEKYPLSYDSFLDDISNKNTLAFILLNQAKVRVRQFLNEVPPPYIYGLQEQTLNSLVIAHITVKQEGGSAHVECINISPSGEPVMTVLNKYLLSPSSDISKEIKEDIEYVLGNIMNNELVLSSKLIATMEQVLKQSPESIQVDDENVLKFMWFITQLLCVRMIKELLQLMPPEVFLAMKEKIPQFYVGAYMDHHYHFNLEELVKDLIEKSSDDTSSVPNKILCYSRTTSFIFETLPHEFFDFDSDAAKFEKQKKLKIAFPQLQENDISCLCVLQVLYDSVGADIPRKINKFLFMHNYEVMLLLVNMQDVSKETVNYLRLTIEESEFQMKQKKKFVLLLHFPSENFFIHCYPSYFHDGWNFYYLDAVAPTAHKDVIDLKTCFHYAFSNESNCEMKSMEKVVDSLLSIEVAAFSAARNGRMLPKKLLDLLTSESQTDKKQSIGDVLKLKFCKQWTPSRMMQTLQQSANSALSLDYTLNMTDAINTIIKSDFFNFMHYMLTLLTKHGVLSILSNKDSSRFMNLIGHQIESIDLPTSTTEIKIQSSICIETTDIPVHFPFFHNVYHVVENLLKSHSSLHTSNISKETLDGSILDEKDQGLLLSTVRQMDNDPNLWVFYVLQFLSLFHNGVTENSELLKYFYDKTKSTESTFGKMVWLHRSFSLIPHDIISLLKFSDSLSTHDDSEKSSETSILEYLTSQQQCAERLIDRFFSILIACSQDSSGKEFKRKTDQLLSKYRDVFLSSPLKELVCTTLTPETEVKRDSIAVFFTLINTNVTSEQAIKLLKHFVNYSSQFAMDMRHRMEYLLKIPVEKVTDAPFIMLFSDTSIDEFKKSNMLNFIHQILKVIVDYSSVEQKQQLVNWICWKIFTSEVLSRIPFLRCEESGYVSSLCILKQMFDIAVGCDKQYLKQEVQKKEKNLTNYVPYYLRWLSVEDLNLGQRTSNMEPLKSLLFLRKLSVIIKKKTGIGELISQYNKLQKSTDLWSCVKREAIVMLIVEETAKNIVNRSDTLIVEVDRILTDEYYGLFLVFKIFISCKSFKGLRKLLLPENELSKYFSCLMKIRESYSQENRPVFPEITPSSLIDSIQNTTVVQTAKHIFHKVSLAVKEMVDSAKQEIPRSLMEIMINSCIQSQQNLKQPVKSLFKMSLFLSLYHHLYLAQIQSTELAELLSTKVKLYIEEEYTLVMSIFISGGKRISNTAQEINHLFSTFSNPSAQTDDFKDMWNCVANLVACVLGTGKNISNFWLHLFNPSSLDGTYIPGSTTGGQVGKNKKFYDNAMELSDSGFCETDRSFLYLTRGKTSLACTYFIQWANYACLCVYLLGFTTVNGESPFIDGLFQAPVSAHNNCLKSMERLWNFLLLNLGITSEQRIILVINCIGKLFEKMQSSETLRKPCFTTQKELDEYEKYINNEIFISAWNDMLKQTTVYHQQIKEGTIDEKIVQLQNGYPLFADEQSFLMLMMTSTNYYDESCPLYVLYQFILNRPELDYGVRILPEMVDFYQWIHKQFPYCLTRKETETMTMSQLLEDELKNAATDDQYRHRRAQFTKICEHTHRFQQKFNVPSDQGLLVLTGDLFVNEVISTNDSSDLILKWINFFINKNNSFVDSICQSTYGSQDFFLKKLTNDYHAVSSLEVKPFLPKSLLGYSDISDLMPLVEKCCCLSSTCFTSTFEDDNSLLKKIVPQVYHLKQLQDDVISTIIVKMRHIKPVQSIAMRFAFKNVQESVTAIFLDSAAVSLDDLENSIPMIYKVKPDENYHSKALKHCHSLSYFSLVDITIGLRIAAEYIIQVHQCEKISLEVKNETVNTSLPSFLKKHVLFDENTTCCTTKVFKDVLGIDITRINNLQYMFLQDMFMKDIMKALHVFVGWLEDGMYDFSSFPLVLKKDLDRVHEQTFSKIQTEAIARGEENKVLENVRLVTHLLASCEKTVREIIDPDTANNKSLKDLLPPSTVHNRGFENFPDVQVCQYVRYRLALKRMHNSMFKRIQQRVPGSYGLDLTWSDRIHMDNLLQEIGVKLVTLEIVQSPVSDIQLCDLTCEQVVKFIREKGFDEEYASSAEESEIDGDAVLTMKDRRLRRLLGMNTNPVVFLQFKFMIRRKYAGTEVGTLALRFPPKETARFCDKFDSLKSAVPFVLKHSIDGEMLAEADMDVLKQISTDFQDAKQIIEEHLHD